jgi:hypothetical protein
MIAIAIAIAILLDLTQNHWMYIRRTTMGSGDITIDMTLMF